jgi:hypothetical protein
MIYFVRAETTPFVKIGFAAVLHRRLRVLRTCCPFPLIVVREMDGDRLTEAALHSHYAARRTQGEWFNWCPTMLTVEVSPKERKQAKPRNSRTIWLANRAGFKTVADLADALGIKAPSINQWEKIPPIRAVEIERVSGGKVTRAELRPDIFGGAA